MTGLRFTTLNHPSDNAFYQAGLTHPHTDCRFVSLAHRLSFFGQDLNQIFTLQSTQVSSKLILARWKGSKVMQLPTRGGSICFHTGVELMASFSSVLSVLSIGNNILLTRESKIPLQQCTIRLDLTAAGLCMGSSRKDFIASPSRVIYVRS